MSAGGAKLQPIAALCAVLMVVWGGVAVASVVAQIEINHKLDLWPSTLDSWAAWSVLLSFAAAVVGVPVLVCGTVGFGRRAGLHVGGWLVLLSIACTFGALVIDNVKFHVPWFGESQSLWLNYRYGLTWHDLPAAIGFQRWWFFAEYLLLPLAAVVLLLWLVVLATGAGRPAPSSGLGYAYVAAPQADYRYVVTPDRPATDGVAEDRGESEPAREVPPLTEPRDVPAPAGAAPYLAPDLAPAEVAPAEVAPAEVAPVEVAPAEVAPVEHPEDETPEPAAGDARPADDERVWFVTVQGADHGPYSRAQLRGYAAEGRLHDGTITHLAGGEDQPLIDVLGG